MKKIFTLFLLLNNLLLIAQEKEELYFKDTVQKIYLLSELDSKPDQQKMQKWVKQLPKKFTPFDADSRVIKNIKQKFALLISEEGKVIDAKLLTEDYKCDDSFKENENIEIVKNILYDCKIHNINTLKNIDLKWLILTKDSKPVSYQTYLNLDISN